MAKTEDPPQDAAGWLVALQQEEQGLASYGYRFPAIFGALQYLLERAKREDLQKESDSLAERT